MTKISVDIASIGKMKLKCNLIVDEDESKYKHHRTINKFKFNGSDYLKISPNPYLTIDISKTADKSDINWNSNNVVTINKISLFVLQRKIKKLIKNFSIPDLFFIKDNKLYLNKKVSLANGEIVRTANKTIKMLYCVVSDNNDVNEYEGIAFMINSIDNICFLTYDELEYLYYELSNINMQQMALYMLNIYLLEMKRNDTHENILKVDPLIESKEVEIIEMPSSHIVPPSEIPEDI